MSKEIRREQVNRHMFGTFFGQSLLYCVKVDVDLDTEELSTKLGSP